MNSIQRLSKFQKIILALHELSNGTKTNIKFEDIVVKVFKEHPEEFHLRGYPEYPDSGDLVHKPLYDAKKKGLITAGNKIFCFTDRGLKFATDLLTFTSGKKIQAVNRLSRYAEKEVNRVAALDGFRNLFIGGQREKILDTDFYNYLGVTVRTDRNDFQGRVETMRGVIEELREIRNDGNQPLYSKIIDYHKFLFAKFKDEIIYKSSN